MKHSTLYAVLALSLVALSGCNDSDSDGSISSSSAVYSGVAYDDSGLPVEAQLIVEPSQTPILTLSDDRDHLTSYAGTQSSNGSTSFSAVQFSCQSGGATVSCQTNNGDVQLHKQTLEKHTISDFQGTYQALWDDALFSLTVNSQGDVSLAGEQCQSTGTLYVSKEVDNLVELDLAGEDCGLEGMHAYAFLHVENDSLYSVDLVSSQQNFPISWVRN